MQIYARISGGAVRELLEIPDDMEIGVDLYSEDVAKECVLAGANVVVGMLYDATGKVFSAAPELPIDLAAYAKAKRDEAEAAGITVNGVAVASAPDDQTRVSNAYSGMQVTGAASIRFKAAAGFMVLSLEQVKAVGAALFAHTQACFDAEDKVDAALAESPPAITTRAQVDAVFAAIPSAY